MRLRLVKRRTPDLQTAIEITDRFAEIFPDDPTKGYFALFGYGVNNGKVAPVTAEPEPEKEQPTAVADLSIADVLKTPEFYNNLKVVISDLENIRRNARISANAPLKRHPIDRLQEKGVFEPGQMTVLYASAMDKKLYGYSSSERTFILKVGGEAFNKTMKQFVDQEKKDNESIKK